MTQLTPSQEDPYVHGLLSSLETFAPRGDFADRVMSQVWQPAPTWAQQLVQVRRALFNRKRLWIWTGALAAGSAVSIVVAVAAALTYRVQVATALSVAWTMAGQVWRIAVSGMASVTVFTMRWLEPVLADTTTVVACAVASTLLVAMSAFGLQRTIRQYRTERVLLHVGK